MYCYQCGAELHGDYCSHCGAKQIIADGARKLLPQSWAEEIRYEVLLRQPDVRKLIVHYASQAHQRSMSADDFLKLCDNIFVLHTGVSLAKIGAIVQPIYAALGIKTGKVREEILAKPSGKVLVAIICSLARHGQPLNKVEQGQDSCLFKAGLPSDMWSFSGDLVITIKRQKQATSVQAVTVIKGQLFDWGKSKRILTELFDDIKSLPI